MIYGCLTDFPFGSGTGAIPSMCLASQIPKKMFYVDMGQFLDLGEFVLLTVPGEVSEHQVITSNRLGRFVFGTAV